MNKIITILSGFLLFTFLSLPVQAAEDNLISGGYTPEGIYYTVYELEPESNSTFSIGDTIYVYREFHYTGIITPPSPVTWTEIHNGITYTGSLKLYSVDFENNTTIACYKGTLVAIE